jgi:N-acetylmuramoyl-L-alanine amidase
LRSYFRLASSLAALGLFFLAAGHPAGQSGPGALTLVSRDGRRTIPMSTINNREFVALDDLAAMFQLAVREESGAITVSYRGRTIVLTPDQALASVAGRLISLPAPTARVGNRWMVPLDFIGRALAPIYDTRLELRAATRLLVMGDLRVPRLTMRYETVSAGARLTVDAAPQTATVVTQENGRILIRFDADALDGAIPPVQGQGLAAIVQAIRAIDPSTIAVDVGPRFTGFRASTQNIDASSRLVVDFVATIPTDTAAPPPPPPPLPSGDLPVFGQPTATIRTIVIDAGHGGEDTGTKGANGTFEKDVTLSVARRLRAVLENRLGARVLLTREDDRSVPLDERTAAANNNKADLFLSLHANASLRPATTGATIFVASFNDADRASAALSPARVPIFGGGSRDIELVPWYLAQIRHVDQSTELARFIQHELESRVPLTPRPIEIAPFRVLESANMPAALIEMGYLTNGDQERQMAAADFQASFAQAVADAVARFRDFLSGSGGDR